MMTSLKRLLAKLVTFFFLLLLLISLLGIFAPLLSPNKVPLIQLIPAILVFIIPFQMLAWRYFRKRNRLFSYASAAVILGSAWVGLQDWSWSEKEASNPAALRVASYNTRNFNFTGRSVDSVIQVLKPLQADVICFQEFRNYRVTEKGPRATEVIAESLGMPHFYHFRTGKYFQGVAIFSHYPIVSLDTLFWDQDEPNNGMLATLETPNGKVGVGNFHLSSYQFSSIKMDQNTLAQQLLRLIRNSFKVIPLHQQHINEVLGKTQNYPYPLILTADMNTVPHSHVVSHFRKRFQDSFRKKGRGLGWTYPFWGRLGVRIDYQFASPDIHILSHKVIKKGNSDHFPLLGVYHLP